LIALLSICGAAAAASIAAAPRASPADPATGYSDRPIGMQPPSATAPEDSLLLFKDKNFDDRMTQVSDITASKAPWKAHSFGTSAKHFSSIRWNLPRGVIVTLYEEDDGLGRTINLWGTGEIAALKDWKLDNQLSGWSWNYVGGVRSTSKSVKEALSERPRFAREVETIAADSMVTFRDRDGKDPMPPIDRISDRPANTYHEVPKGTSSLRWNLPEGVIVTFAATKDGVGQQLAAWGSGQFDTFAHWKMNDKLKFYSWHWLGEKK